MAIGWQTLLIVTSRRLVGRRVQCGYTLTFCMFGLTSPHSPLIAAAASLSKACGSSWDAWDAEPMIVPLLDVLEGTVSHACRGTASHACRGTARRGGRGPDSGSLQVCKLGLMLRQRVMMTTQ